MQKYLLIFLTFLLCVSVKKVLCKTIYVGKSKNITTIQKALALAHNGDTVLVEAGIYQEGNIIINTSIVLKGINNPVLDGENKYEIISIKSDNVTVDGFKLQHAGRSEIRGYCRYKNL